MPLRRQRRDQQSTGSICWGSAPNSRALHSSFADDSALAQDASSGSIRRRQGPGEGRMREDWGGHDGLEGHELCPLHPETLLTKRETARVCGFSISALDRLPDAWPKLHLSPRRVGWRLRDVLAWLASQK